MDVENEERPFYETKMDQRELEGLDRDQFRSEIGSECYDQNYVELKESIRVMEERIAFLIHRLQESKKEIVGLKETNLNLEETAKEEKKMRKELRVSFE